MSLSLKGNLGLREKGLPCSGSAWGICVLFCFGSTVDLQCCVLVSGVQQSDSDIYMYGCIYVYIYVCICVYIYVCICVYSFSDSFPL